MLTSKQRAKLRGLANSLEPVVIVGKGGVTENVIQETRNALGTRELMKGRVLESAMMSAREVCDELCDRVNADGVQTIGANFVIYKKNDDLPEGKRIKL